MEDEGRERRIVLIFDGIKDFRPGFDGEDMGKAPLAALYELDVFVPENHLPIVGRAELVSALPARR